MGNNASIVGLSKEDFELLKKKTNYTEDSIRRWHKVFKKECPSGQLTKNKFVKVYKHIFPDGKSGDFYDHMFRTFDKDKSGSLSFVEFMLAIYTTDKGTPEEILELTFHLYDIDNNNKIESHEIAEILTALYLLKGQTRQQLGNLCEVQANDLMTRMDLNDDKALSKDEFIQGCMAEKDLSKLLSGQ